MKKRYTTPEAQQILFVSAQPVSIHWEQLPSQYGNAAEGSANVLSSDIKVAIK